MSKVNENHMTEGLSGMFGNKLVFRQRFGKTILAKKPRRNNILTSEQIVRKERFQDAVDYALDAINNPVKKEEYKKLAPLGTSAYNMAIADFLSDPRVDKLDVAQYTGMVGDVISIMATDKVKVASVTVKVFKPDGSLLEEGAAVVVRDGRMWLYLTTALNTELAGSTVTAVAADLAGHVVEAAVTL